MTLSSIADAAIAIWKIFEGFDHVVIIHADNEDKEKMTESCAFKQFGAIRISVAA